jgi:hypothetical protein
MPLSPTPRLAFGLNTRPPRSYSCVYHLASLPAEAFGCVIGVSFGAEFPLGARLFKVFVFLFPFCLILLRFLSFV